MIAQSNSQDYGLLLHRLALRPTRRADKDIRSTSYSQFSSGPLVVLKMKAILTFAAALATLGLVAGESSTQGDDHESGKLLFSDVISVCKQQQKKMSQHPFLKMLADQSIPARQRMTFVPYWAYFAMAAADVLDTWIYIPNPQNELEERINIFVEEEGFHYNLFLHDMEQVFRYTRTVSAPSRQ